MRLTKVLRAHQISTWYKRKWAGFRHKKVEDMGDEAVLAKMQIPVYDPEDIFTEMRHVEKADPPVEFVAPLPPMNNTHPDWHDRICHRYVEKTTFFEGVKQSLLLTKAILLKEGLPDEIEGRIGSITIPDQNKLVQRCVLHSNTFDAIQNKLPPIESEIFWHYPLPYGIPKDRGNQQLMKNLYRLCDIPGGKNPSCLRRSYLEKMEMKTTVEKDGDLLQFHIVPQLVITSHVAQLPFASNDMINDTSSMELPDLYPLKSNANFSKENIYNTTNVFPLPSDSAFPNINTAVFLYNEPYNKMDEETFGARTVVHTFSTALAQAVSKYGNNKLLQPVTMQAVHTDGVRFQFSVFQLNTLDLNGIEGVKNILWMTPEMRLFDVCGYVKGKPVIEGYNPTVFETLMAMQYCGMKL